MKELKSYKQVKKKPGQFKKAKKRNKNIQHNRDQIKLLRSGIIEYAELFILNENTFNKVTIKLLNDSVSYTSPNVVYLSHHGRGSRLRTGTLTEKDGIKIIEEGFISMKYIIGTIVKIVILK